MEAKWRKVVIENRYRVSPPLSIVAISAVFSIVLAAMPICANTGQAVLIGSRSGDWNDSAPSEIAVGLEGLSLERYRRILAEYEQNAELRRFAEGLD